ncbi:MAG: hypothetical protein J1F16_05025 [Muribaculaceae bacterium]|nr:hypothetical protein [Muribaculaceae bacterium]
MKQKISYGSWNKTVDVITWIIWIIFIAVFVLFLVFFNKSYDNVWFWLAFGFFVLGWCWTFFCIPTSVSADDEYLSVNKPLRKKKYNISDIESVEHLDGPRKNYAYYGSPKNPVIVTMKDGTQFVVGTSDSKEFIDYINKIRSKK